MRNDPYENHAGPGHSPQMHPARRAEPKRLDPLLDPRNFVPPLSPIFGPAPWSTSCEVGPRDACERCGQCVRADWIFCAGCHRVSRDNQRKLTAERRCDPKTDPKPKPKPSAVPLTARQKAAAAIAEKREKMTARNQKRLLDAYRRYAGNPEADAWAERLGLPVDAKAAG